MVSQRRNLLILRIGLIVAMIGLILGGVRRYRTQHSLSEARDVSEVTGLYVDPKTLFFGETWEDDRFAWTLPIENRSASDVSIERFYNSCVCTEIKPRSLVIPAGQSREIRLGIDLMTDHGYEKSKAAVRDFAVTVEAVVAGPDKKKVNQGWQLRGKVKRAIEFDQAEIDFGMHSEREQPLPARRVALKSFTPLDSLVVTGGLANFPERVLQRPANPSLFELEITPRGVLPEGQYSFTLNVVPVLTNGTRLAAKKLPVRAWIAPDVQAFPPEIQFGAIPLGEMAETTMTIASLTGSEFTVTGWDCNGEMVKIGEQEGSRREPGFKVQWTRVSSLGPHEAEIVIRINTDNKKEKLVRVPVKCLGIEEISAKLE